ncbi:MAG: nicotinate phosphoribosyltransferase [Acidobacteriaceae bacterium]|nr:nicotinate phosphoribosyltransferase [Acidobacteriaceae bacterium]
MIINHARRAHDHNWELDPIARSLLDTDFYKLLMLQFIWKHFPTTRATFTVTNRTAQIPLGRIVNFAELREQLEHTRQLRFAKSELIWLAGNTFYGKRGIFEPDFLAWLESGFRLSDFELAKDSDGQVSLRFEGLWTETTLWEIYALSVLDELKTRASLKRLSELELDILYARAKTRLWEKMARLRAVPGLSLSDFGTRRRHSFLWQEYVVNAMSDVLGPAFSGTSNTFLAYKHDLEAIGTNAHELPMALAALARTDDELRSAQYRLLELWQQTYQGELLILLPDTFGTTQFLANAPAWVARWTGQRIDSKDPFIAGDEYIDWLISRGCDPRTKRLIASDALDVDVILALHAHFDSRIRFSAGWGTFLTNDFRDCNPQGGDAFDPVSLVCKLTEVDGRPAVKLSDNYAKALGPQDEIDRYRKIFGTAGVSDLPISA